MTSGVECLDIEFAGPVAKFVKLVNRHMPHGTAFNYAARLGNGAPSLMALLVSVSYELVIPSLVLSQADVARAHNKFQGHSIFQVQKQSQDKIKTIDLKKAVISLDLLQPGGDLSQLDIRLNLADPEGNNATPSLVLATLFKLDDEAKSHCHTRRTALLDKDGAQILPENRIGTVTNLFNHNRLDFIRFLDT